MKTFNEFINEGQNFLRSIRKNDAVDTPIPVRDLEVGDWFWFANEIRAYHCQITNITECSNEIEFSFHTPLIGPDSWRYEFEYAIDEYTSRNDEYWVFTTDKDVFEEFVNDYCKDDKILECPIK